MCCELELMIAYIQGQRLNTYLSPFGQMWLSQWWPQRKLMLMRFLTGILAQSSLSLLLHPTLSWRGLWTISYRGGSRSAMMQSDGFHISVQARTSRPLSIIISLMSNALLQTEWAFNSPMVIFATASIGVNSVSMGVNSAEDISHDLDLGCLILYSNKDFLTL